MGIIQKFLLFSETGSGSAEYMTSSRSRVVTQCSTTRHAVETRLQGCLALLNFAEGSRLRKRKMLNAKLKESTNGQSHVVITPLTNGCNSLTFGNDRFSTDQRPMVRSRQIEEVARKPRGSR